MSIAQDWFEQHRPRFQQAQVACVERNCWSPFPETPGQYPDAPQAQAAGLAAFQAHLGGEQARRFALDQPGITGVLGAEVSPYTCKPLGIAYPHSDVDALFDAGDETIRSHEELWPRLLFLALGLFLLDLLLRRVRLFDRDFRRA